MSRREPGTAARASTQWPLLVVVLGAVVGLLLAVFGDDSWRLGAVIIGASVGFGALERMVLPSRQAGLLQVRTKAFDVAVLAVTGAAIIVLALAVPPGR
jgi:hypothetical protein